MKDDFVGRVRELGELYRELMTEVEEQRWRNAAELAGALELDLDDLQTRLRVEHKTAMKTARQSKREDQIAGLNKGLGKRRLQRWVAQREAWIERASTASAID